MNDTTPEIEKMVRDRYMQMTGEERFLIGIRMFDTARAIVLSSLPKDLSEKEKRRQLCERFYGAEAGRAFR
ncbi:MAG TPA: hypothetical protein VF268_03290 [Gammaproteobacteria bacterium]